MLVFSCYSRSPRLLQTLSSAYISASFAFVRAENGRNDLQYYQPKHQFIHCQEEQMFGRAPNKRDVYCRTRHRETGQPSTQLLLSLMRGTCRQITIHRVKSLELHADAHTERTFRSFKVTGIQRRTKRLKKSFPYRANTTWRLGTCRCQRGKHGAQH